MTTLIFNNMKIVYIAHPVGGDVTGNISRICDIVKEINLQEPDVVPFVPYMADLLALDDNDPQQRERGIKNDTAILRSGLVNEIRLYGNRISAGMRAEINLGMALGMKITAMTPETASEL